MLQQPQAMNGLGYHAMNLLSNQKDWSMNISLPHAMLFGKEVYQRGTPVATSGQRNAVKIHAS